MSWKLCGQNQGLHRTEYPLKMEVGGTERGVGWKGVPRTSSTGDTPTHGAIRAGPGSLLLFPVALTKAES